MGGHMGEYFGLQVKDSPDSQPARHQPDGSAAPAASWPAVAQL
jgi:hypothetical protein